MKELLPFVDEQGGTIVELGSRDGHDAKTMADIFQASRVVTIEANPECHAQIERDYPEFENYNCAILDRTGNVDFYRVRSTFPAPNIGQSSIMSRDIYAGMADVITVPGLTMDSFTEEHHISEIAVMKIDVEGATYQVLEGFSKIRMTKLLHVEAEHVQYWDYQRLYSDVAEFLVNAGYEQVYFTYAYDEQSDSIWRRID